MHSKQPETLPTFQRKQAEFTAFIRNPEQSPAPTDVPFERIAIYAELMFNNIESFLSTNFPVLRQILTDTAWLHLVRDFYQQHHSRSPYFSEIPEEFLSYLQNERNNPDDYPFLLELAHYEWVEMAIAIAQEESTPFSNSAIAHIQEQTIALSPVAWPLAYQYPVHQISPQYLPHEPTGEYTLLCVYRDLNEDVKFLHITPMTYRLLEYLQESPAQPALNYLVQLIQEIQHPHPEFIIQTGTDTLQDLAQKGIIIPHSMEL